MGLLEGDLLKKVQDVAINPGANFLVGQATSSFGSAIQTVSSVTTLAAAPLQAAGVIMEVTEKAVSYITSELVSYLTTAAVEMAKFDLSIIPKKVAYVTAYYTKSKEEIIKEIKKPVDITQDEDFDKEQDEKMKRDLEAIQKKVSDFKTKMDTKLSYVNKSISSITAYIQEGPKWVEQKLAYVSYNILKSVKEETGKQHYLLEEEKKRKINEIVEPKARKAADAINNEIKKVQVAIIEEINLKKKEALLLANAAKAQAIMLLKGLLGA